MGSSSGPLSGCRVIEAARFVTGPYASQLLADLGADVVKIEDPKGGDAFRGWGKDGGYGPPFLAFNRSKRSMTLDLKNAAAREIVIRMARGADVFVENFRPGVADKLGIGYAALSAENPRLIYCSITGMGRDGPYAQRPSYDIVGQGLSGLLSLLVELDAPRPMGPTFSDTLTGLFAAYGILAALQGRERTGQGQFVETSLLQATMAFMNEPYATLFGSGRPPDAFQRPRASQVYAFIGSDGLPLAVHLSSPDKFWQAFVTASGCADMIDDPRFRTHADRRTNWEAIHARLEPIFRTRTRAEWLAILHKADVPATPIYKLDEALNDPQIQHLDMIQSVEHKDRGQVNLVGFPVRLSETPLGPISAPATLGEHTEEVLAEIGYSADAIAKLRRDGAL